MAYYYYEPSEAGSSEYPPLDPTELAEEAEKFEWNPQIPLKYYVGALDALYREGRNYLHERNYAKAYMLLFRFSILYLNRLSTVPEAQTAEGRALLRPTKHRIKEVLVELERIKPDLEDARNKWFEHTRAAAAQTQATQTQTAKSFAARDAALSWNAKAQAKLLDASDHQDLAVDLATKELRRRDAARRATRQAGVSVEEERRRRTGGVWDDWDTEEPDPVPEPQLDFEPEVPQPPPPKPSDDLRQQMEWARHRLDRQEKRSFADHLADNNSSNSNSNNYPDDTVVPVSYHYPSISKSQPLQYDYGSHSAASGSASAAGPSPPPPRPPRKERTERKEQQPRPPRNTPYAQQYPASSHYDYDRYDQQHGHYEHYDPPPVPPPRVELPSTSSSYDELPSYSQAVGSTGGPTPPPVPEKKRLVDEKDEKQQLQKQKEKEQYTFRPAAYLEDGTPIRPVFLPDQLRHDFVRIATANTRKGIETCGILCGTNINNALFITCLLIPEQHGTPDTCETTNEAATFEFFEKEDLLQVGWIHTHPTQTCFMSSRDLHTQAGYQIMMDESVAIVCAPNHEPSWGVFRLTKPPGLQHLLNCTEVGTFHQHSLPPDALYTDAQNPPGHVFVTSRMNYRVHDMRK